jgi:hypothetical protein
MPVWRVMIEQFRPLLWCSCWTVRRGVGEEEHIVDFVTCLCRRPIENRHYVGPT